ncbi:MAG: flavin reductase family protein [Chlamydiota bacterium]|nr:flavin reductase family protein [Chlamydiota bacterium]
MKKAMRMTGYGLYIFTSIDDEVAASTITWFSQVSFEPPLVMVALRNDSHSLRTSRKKGFFAVNFLAHDQKDIAAKFFRQPIIQDNKMNGLEIETALTGIPLLKDAPAYIECQIVEDIDRGDHAVIIGEIIHEGLRREVKPLSLSDTGWKYEK